jgi:hypothetical protein
MIFARLHTKTTSNNIKEESGFWFGMSVYISVMVVVAFL